jgi:hypothetical protein
LALRVTRFRRSSKVSFFSLLKLWGKPIREIAAYNSRYSPLVHFEMLAG